VKAGLAARARLAHRRAGKHLAVVATKYGDEPVRLVTARSVRRAGVDHAAQRERERPGLARPGQSLGLHGLQLERRGLSNYGILAVLFAGSLIDGKDADIFQNDFGGDHILAVCWILLSLRQDL